MKVAAAIAAALLLMGCRQAATSPDAAYRGFVKAAAAAHQGQEEKLLDDFDAPTRAALEARAKMASAATGKNMPDDAAYQMVLGAANVPALSSLKVVQSSADAATLEVATDGGPTQQVKMVREQGRWRIHLDALPAGG